MLASSLALTVMFAAEARGDTAGGGGGGRVVLEVRACPGVSAEAIRHILGIEIGDLLVAQGQAIPTAAERLTIRCAGNLAWVEAAGEGGVAPVDRTFRFDDFPGDAAPRALALAGLELLAARSPAVRARLQARREAGPSPPPARPDPEAAPSLRPRNLRLGLAGVWRTFFVEQGLSVWGGQAQLAWDIGRRWYLAADADASGALRDAGIGETSALLLSGGVAFGLRAGTRDGAGTLGLGARVGMARLAGSTSEANVSATSAIRPWGGPLASASVVAGLGAFALSLTAEAGYSLFMAEGLSNGASVLAVGGAWVAISAGAAFRP